jgi:hypothetical protein
MKYMLQLSSLSKTKESVCLNSLNCTDLSLVATQAPNLSPSFVHHLRRQIKVSHPANHRLHELWAIHAWSKQYI